VESTRFAEAFSYSLEVHRGQRRRVTGTPYIGHVLGVCSLVLDDGGDEDQAIGALLHDAGENAGGRPRIEDIRNRFGERVARIVEECSDTLERPEPPWRERKEAYVAAAEHHTLDALHVSLGDKLYNVRSLVRDYRVLGESVWDHLAGDRGDILWYYRSLLDVFRRRLPESSMVAELEAALAEFERLIDR
jgi:(p)ppGpp synthase/HD superfamily hydrolase